MAGPQASVLVRAPLSAVQRSDIQFLIARRSERREEDAFWIDDRPFVMRIGEQIDGELEETIAEGLPDVLGWSPRDLVHLGAAGDEAIDHVLLGGLCLQLAKDLNGLVDFGGTILSLDHLPPPVRVECPNGLAGCLYVTEYVGAGAVRSFTQYGDAEFLESWLNAATYRLVK